MTDEQIDRIAEIVTALEGLQVNPRHHQDEQRLHRAADVLLLKALRVLGGERVAVAWERADDRIGFEYGE